MTSTPKLYIASKEVLFGAALGEEHLYLYLDPDTDGDHDAATGTDMQIIRGGEASNYEETGLGSSILIEVGSDSDVSADAFVLIDTPESRNFREIFSGAAATSTWATLQSLAMTYRIADTALSDVYATDYTYSALGTNSNSFAATLLNRLGLNLADIAPYADGSTSEIQTIGWFPYHSHILDSGDDGSYTVYKDPKNQHGLFDNEAYHFHDRSGDDTITVKNGARLEIVIDLNSGHHGANTVLLEGATVNQLSMGAFYSTSGGLTLTNDLGIFEDASQLHNVGAQSVMGKLWVNGQFDSMGNRGVDILVVENTADGTTKTIDMSLVHKEDLGTGIKLTNIATANTGKPNLNGTDKVDVLYGDDIANTFTGGRGADIMRGNDGTDKYKWSIGDGDDVIYDDWSDGDKLVLGPGITDRMVEIEAVGADLVITIESPTSGGTITIKGMAADVSTFLSAAVENLVYEANPTTSTYLWGTYNNTTHVYDDLNDNVVGSNGVSPAKATELIEF